MAVSPPNTVLLLLLLLLLVPPSSAISFSLPHYRTALSLFHSLTTRVSLLRSSLGDLAGSARAKALARNIEYLQGLSELTNALSELSRAGSDSVRLAWAAGNYDRVLAVAPSLFKRLLRVYRQPSQVREFVETVQREFVEKVQREVVDGRLLRDFLELGEKDVKGLVQILKDIALQYTALPHCRTILSLSHYRTVLSLSHYRTVLFLSHSLTMRVSLLRASRGDLVGSARAKALARYIEYLQGLSELTNALNELSRAGSDSERLAWAARNYDRVLVVAPSLYERLLRVYRQPSQVREFVETVQREFVETVQREVVDGRLLRDCLELGEKDVKALVQILKDIALQYTASSSSTPELISAVFLKLVQDSCVFGWWASFHTPK